jgi:hypothetical protein
MLRLFGNYPVGSHGHPLAVRSVIFFTDAWFASLYSERTRSNLERELHSLE